MSMEKHVNPDELIKKSIDMVESVTNGDEELTLLFESILTRLKSVLHAKNSNKEELDKYKIEQSSVLDQLIIQKLDRKNTRDINQNITGGSLSAATHVVFGFGKDFMYYGIPVVVEKVRAFGVPVASTIGRSIGRYGAPIASTIGRYGALGWSYASWSNVSWYGVIMLFTVVVDGYFALSYAPSIYTYFTRNESRNFMKKLAREREVRINKFVAVAILSGEILNTNVIRLINSTNFTKRDLSKIDKMINKLRVIHKDLPNYQKMQSILTAGYLFTANTQKDKVIVFNKTTFQKCLYMCLGFGVNSEIVAAREAFEIKYIIDGLLENKDRLPIVYDTHYGMIIANINEEFRIIRSNWYTAMPTANRATFDWMQHLLSRSGNIINAELNERATIFKSNWM